MPKYWIAAVPFNKCHFSVQEDNRVREKPRKTFFPTPLHPTTHTIGAFLLPSLGVLMVAIVENDTLSQLSGIEVAKLSARP